MTATPSAARLRRGCRVDGAGGDDERRPHVVRREGVVAPRDAAGDLQIDQAVADAVAAHDLAQHDAQRRRAHRPRDAELAERALEPRHVPRLVDQPAAANLADLVDAVGELVAAILDMDRRARRAARSGR